MAVGESATKLTTSDGVTEWMYPRSNSVLVVRFNNDGIVTKAGAQSMGGRTTTTKRRLASQSSSGMRLSGNGTPLK